MKVVLRTRAFQDLQNINAYLWQQSHNLAEQFHIAFDEEMTLLAAHPFLGRKRHFKQTGIRSWRIRRFEKFLIFYRPTERHVEIVRVLHGSRDVATLV